MQKLNNIRRPITPDGYISASALDDMARKLYNIKFTDPAVLVRYEYDGIVIDIQDGLNSVEEGGGGGGSSYDGDKSITLVGGDTFELVNDEDAPGASHFYATNEGTPASKGWREIVKSLEMHNSGLQLVNDEENPSEWHWYGLTTSAKGWQSTTTQQVVTDLQISGGYLQAYYKTVRVFAVTDSPGWTNEIQVTSGC